MASPSQAAILQILADADTPLHAPELCRRGSGVLKRSTIYVLLGRMQANGLITSTLEAPQPDRSGPRRRFYTLTTAGRHAAGQ